MAHRTHRQRCYTLHTALHNGPLEDTGGLPQSIARRSPPRANNPHSRGGSGAASRAGCEKSLSELSSAPQPLVSSKTPELRHMTGLTIPHLAVVVGDFLWNLLSVWKICCIVVALSSFSWLSLYSHRFPPHRGFWWAYMLSLQYRKELRA